LAPPPLSQITLSDEETAAMFKTYNQGLFHLCPKWEDPLRTICTGLIQHIAVNDVNNHNQYVVALLILPSLLRSVRILKRPCTPKKFLTNAASYGSDAAKYILHVAKLLLPVVSHSRETGRARARNNSSRNSKRHYRKRIHKLFADGRLSAATTTVELAASVFASPEAELPPQPTAQQIRDTLQTLNPPRSDGDVLPPLTEEESNHGYVKFDNTDVRAVLKLLPSGSSNGATGWTCDIIRRLYSEAEAVDYNAIAALFNAFSSGRLPSQHWITSRAALIPKPNNNGFRPLGIGEAWYRYLGRALLYKVGSDTGLKLVHHQLGCGIPGGCEIAARMAQVFLDNNPSHVLIKTDFKNAFNLVPRARIYEGLARYCPTLLPWFRWAYGTSSPLVNSQGEQIGSSETGCRQGDPLAALLFCVAIQAALARMQETIDSLMDDLLDSGHYSPADIGYGMVLSYMDDCTITVPWFLAEAVCTHLQAICEEYGLQLNIAKCRIIGPNVVNLPEDVPFKHLPDGDIVLGNPVGSDDFRLASCDSIISRHIRMLPMLETLQINPMAAFNIIKFCVNARANYLVRVQDVLGLDCLKVFDEAVDTALFRVAQHSPPATVPPLRQILSATLRSLPLMHGGLGVPRYSWIPGHVGVIKSRLYLQNFLELRFSELGLYTDVWERFFPNINIGETNCPLPLHVANHSPRDLSDDILVYQDMESTANIAATQYAAFSSSVAGLLCSTAFYNSPPRAAWYRSSCFEGSGRWLTPPAATILSPYLTLNSDEYRVALRQRLLLAPFEDTEATAHPVACLCTMPLDDKTDPFHFLDCERNQAFNHTRHSRCQELIASFLKKNLLNRSVEITTTPRLHGQDGTLLQEQADLAVHLLPNVYQVVDVTISNPAAATYTTHNNSHLFDDATNLTRENGKLTHYSHTREVIEGKFLPFAIEATGRIGPRAKAWIEEDLLSEETAELVRLGRRTPFQKLQAQLCTAITKCCSEVILYRRRTTWRQRMDVLAAQN